MARMQAIRRTSAEFNTGPWNEDLELEPPIQISLLEAQKRDDFVIKQKALLENGDVEASQLWSIGPSELLLYKNRVFVPQGMRKEILSRLRLGR